MANILLVDSNPVARKAMEGILAQRDHRFAVVETVAEAWSFIRQNLKVDLLIMELKLKDEGGITLIQSLKSDPDFSEIPIIVYTADGDKASVKNVLDLHVQNFLLKPYREELIFAEISKATAKPWRRRRFANEDAVCQKNNLQVKELRALRAQLQGSLVEARDKLIRYIESQDLNAISELLKSLFLKAAKSGARGVQECVRDLNDKAKASDWNGFHCGLDRLIFAAWLIYYHLNPNQEPKGFHTEEEQDRETEEQQRAFWINAPAEGRCPMVSWKQLQRKIDSLSSCPVVESIAAAFQMSATGHPTSLAPLLDLVKRDPSLTAQILIASNRIKKGKEDGDAAAIEEPRAAVALLGERGLATLGGSFSIVEERLMQFPPQSSWPNFRMFQLGTAQLARFVCSYLEMPGLEETAYTAGLIHDIGKLLLVHLYPFAYQATQEYAQRRNINLATAERLFLEATTQEMGAYFAQKQRLPRRFTNVLKWMEHPEEATEDAELVAVVSLARDLCRHNHVGHCGDTPTDEATPLAETAEWRVLKNRVFLNFDLKKFERRAHSECLQIKRELLESVQ